MRQQKNEQRQKKNQKWFHGRCREPDVTLTGVTTAVDEGSGTAAAGEEGQCWCHEPLHDPALPRAQTQAAG